MGNTVKIRFALPMMSNIDNEYAKETVSMIKDKTVFVVQTHDNIVI